MLFLPNVPLFWSLGEFPGGMVGVELCRGFPWKCIRKHAKSGWLGESNYLSVTLIHPHAFFLLIRDQWYNLNHIGRTILKNPNEYNEDIFPLRERKTIVTENSY